MLLEKLQAENTEETIEVPYYSPKITTEAIAKELALIGTWPQYCFSHDDPNYKHNVKIIREFYNEFSS